MLKKTKGEVLVDLVAVGLGNFLYALTVKLFLEPTGLITGGTMGLALTANYLWGTDINLFVLIFNTAMLVLGFFTLGKTFAATTVASTFLSPGFMELIDRTIGQPVLSTDPMLNAFFCGIGESLLKLGRICLRRRRKLLRLFKPFKKLLIRQIYRIAKSFASEIYRIQYCTSRKCAVTDRRYVSKRNRRQPAAACKSALGNFRYAWKRDRRQRSTFIKHLGSNLCQ